MTAITEAQRVHDAWDDALGRKDLDAAMALYTDDAVLQSPLICHLLVTERGVIEGKAAPLWETPETKDPRRSGDLEKRDEAL